MHLAAKFVEAEVKSLLQEFELTSYEKSVLIAAITRAIAAYEEYRFLVEGKRPAKFTPID